MAMLPPSKKPRLVGRMRPTTSLEVVDRGLYDETLDASSLSIDRENRRFPLKIESRSTHPKQMVLPSTVSFTENRNQIFSNSDQSPHSSPLSSLSSLSNESDDEVTGPVVSERGKRAEELSRRWNEKYDVNDIGPEGGLFHLVGDSNIHDTTKKSHQITPELNNVGTSLPRDTLPTRPFATPFILRPLRRADTCTNRDSPRPEMPQHSCSSEGKGIEDECAHSEGDVFSVGFEDHGVGLDDNDDGVAKMDEISVEHTTNSDPGNIGMLPPTSSSESHTSAPPHRRTPSNRRIIDDLIWRNEHDHYLRRSPCTIARGAGQPEAVENDISETVLGRLDVEPPGDASILTDLATMRAEITALREENARLAFDNARLRECCASTNITDPHAPIGPEDSTNTFQDDLDSEIAGEEDPFRVPRRKRKRTEVHDSDTDGGVEAYHDETEDSIEHDADDEVAENLRDETAEDEESDDQPCDPDDDSVAAATVLAGLHAERDAQQARLDTARSRASDVDRHLKSAMWFSRRAVLEFNQAMKEADAAAQRLCDLQDDLGDSAFVEEEFG